MTPPQREYIPQHLDSPIPLMVHAGLHVPKGREAVPGKRKARPRLPLGSPQDIVDPPAPPVVTGQSDPRQTHPPSCAVQRAVCDVSGSGKCMRGLVVKLRH
eukprot:scaffold1900_cov389-Prasinococcus_capsulatus_cf.AAC.16